MHGCSTQSLYEQSIVLAMSDHIFNSLIVHTQAAIPN